MAKMELEEILGQVKQAGARALNIENIRRAINSPGVPAAGKLQARNDYCTIEMAVLPEADRKEWASTVCKDALALSDSIDKSLQRDKEAVAKAVSVDYKGVLRKIKEAGLVNVAKKIPSRYAPSAGIRLLIEQGGEEALKGLSEEDLGALRHQYASTFADIIPIRNFIENGGLSNEELVSKIRLFLRYGEAKLTSQLVTRKGDKIIVNRGKVTKYIQEAVEALKQKDAAYTTIGLEYASQEAEKNQKKAKGKKPNEDEEFALAA